MSPILVEGISLLGIQRELSWLLKKSVQSINSYIWTWVRGMSAWFIYRSDFLKESIWSMYVFIFIKIPQS